MAGKPLGDNALDPPGCICSISAPRCPGLCCHRLSCWFRPGKKNRVSQPNWSCAWPSLVQMQNLASPGGVQAMAALAHSPSPQRAAVVPGPRGPQLRYMYIVRSQWAGNVVRWCHSIPSCKPRTCSAQVFRWHPCPRSKPFAFFPCSGVPSSLSLLWRLFPPAGGNSPSWTPQVLRVQWVWCSLWWPESQHPSPSGGSSVSGLARQWIDHRPAPLQLCNPNPSPGLGLPPPTSVHFLYIWTPSPLLTVSPDQHRWGLGPGFFKSEDPLTFHDAQRCGHFWAAVMVYCFSPSGHFWPFLSQSGQRETV